MEITPYHVVFPHPGQPEQRVLFATKTGALIVVDQADYDLLCRGEVDREIRDDLMEMGLLVESAARERAAVFGFLDAINAVNPNLTVAVVLGMECNFACKYCFEGQQKGRYAMDDQTAGQLVNFLGQQFTPGKEKLTLDLYGGEPLLYKQRIIRLAEQLKPMVEERGAVSWR